MTRAREVVLVGEVTAAQVRTWRVEYGCAIARGKGAGRWTRVVVPLAMMKKSSFTI